MKTRHFYLELKDGEKVIRRVKTSLSSEYYDRQLLEEFRTDSSQCVFFVASSEPERIIN